MTKPRKPRKPGHGLEYTFVFRGKSYSKTFTSRKAGEAWVRKRKGELERREVGVVDGGTFAEAIERFNKLRRPHLSESTRDAYEVYFRTHFEALKPRPLDAIRGADIQEWMSSRLEEGLAPATVKRLFEVARAVFGVARESGMCSSNPCSSIRIKQGASTREVRALEDDEIQALLMACKSVRTRTMVLVGLNTGMRVGEMMGMKWEWVDWRRAVVRIPASVEAGFIPKGKKPREVPLLEPARVELLKWLGDTEGTGQVFEGTNWKRWARALRRRAAKNLGKLRDPKNPAPLAVPFPFRWHMLRHTYVTRLLIKGVAPRIVQAVAGWSSMRMLDRYSHLVPDAYDAITSRFPAGLGPGKSHGTKVKCPTCGHWSRST